MKSFTELDSTPLTARDRCDFGGCGAPAKARACLPSGNFLIFCKHHTDELEQKLWNAGANIYYQYADLFPQHTFAHGSEEEN